MKRINAWHFCNDWELLDGTPLVIGGTYHVDSPIQMCSRGLHGSRRLVDALQYASGNILSRVQLWGNVIERKDKLVASNRLVVDAIDAENLLQEYSCIVAENMLGYYGIEDERLWAAIKAKRDWLAGRISDKELTIILIAAEAAISTITSSATKAVSKVESKAAAWIAIKAVFEIKSRFAARAAIRAADLDASWMVAAVRTAAWIAPWVEPSDELNVVFESYISDYI